MARPKYARTTWWFLSLQMTLYLSSIFVQGAEEDDAFRNGKNLILEYFLPINFPVPMKIPIEREKRDIEGSGEDETVFSELNEKVGDGDEIDKSTQSTFARMLVEGEKHNLTNFEGSGEVDASVMSSEEDDSSSESISVGTEDSVEGFTTTEVQKSEESEEVTDKVITEKDFSTEMIFDKSEDFRDESLQETTTVVTTIKDLAKGKEIIETTTEVPAVTTEVLTIAPKSETKEAAVESTTTQDIEDTTTEKTIPPTETTVIPLEDPSEDSKQTVILKDITTSHQETTVSPTETPETTTIKHIPTVPLEEETPSTDILPPVVETTPNLESHQLPESIDHPVEETSPPHVEPPPVEATSPHHVEFLPPVKETTPQHVDLPTARETNPNTETLPSSEGVPVEAKQPNTETLPSSEGVPVEAKQPTTTPVPVIEEVFKQVKTAQESLEAMPGNILRKENLTMGADPLLIVTNTRLMDSEENVQLSSAEPKRLGAYIVIGLILLSFFSLVGYITFRKRLNRKRIEFESNQETNDTEKALLSLSDYKDNSDLEENHLKNNEITPIVVKSNTQLNKFEKNTNFSSPKNLNTIANEKNIEKDNVLKSTAENLTQVIIEDSPKDIEEEKNAPSMEKLIVKTRIDQDSIPKKPIIVNRSSTGYMPIPQENV